MLSYNLKEIVCNSGIIHVPVIPDIINEDISATFITQKTPIHAPNGIRCKPKINFGQILSKGAKTSKYLSIWKTKLMKWLSYIFSKMCPKYIYKSTLVKKIKLQQYKAKYDKAKEGKWLLAIKWNVHPVKYTINGLKQKTNICELFDHFDSDDNIFHVSVYHRWFNQGSER